jgi:hypothetical protein
MTYESLRNEQIKIINKKPNNNVSNLLRHDNSMPNNEISSLSREYEEKRRERQQKHLQNNMKHLENPQTRGIKTPS